MSKLMHALLQGLLFVLQVLNAVALPPKYAPLKPFITSALSYVQGHLAVYNHKNGA